MKKIEDTIVYRNRSFYCAFPSVVCLPDGELIVAFRRAPNRKRFGASLTCPAMKPKIIPWELS